MKKRLYNQNKWINKSSNDIWWPYLAINLKRYSPRQMRSDISLNPFKRKMFHSVLLKKKKTYPKWIKLSISNWRLSSVCSVLSLTCTHTRVYCFDYYYMLQKIVDLFWCWKFFRFCTSFFLFFFSFLFHLKKKDQKKKRRRRGEKKIIWLSLFLFSAFIIIYRKRTKRRRRRTYTHKYTRYPSHPFFILFYFFLLLFCVHDDTDDDQKKLALIPPIPRPRSTFRWFPIPNGRNPTPKKRRRNKRRRTLSLYYFL